MDRFPLDNDGRREKLITETRAQFSSLSHAVLAGDPVATKRITDALGNFIADDNAAAELVRAVLTNSQAALTMLTDLLWAEAGELADAEVAAMERRRAEESIAARAERWLWNRGVLA
jgi:hypothetical protein